MVAIECVVRGYLSGSGWKEYKTTGAVCGIPLPNGLRESDKLPEPIFTPATKASQRARREHFVSIEMVKIAGRELSEQLRDLSIKIYQTAADYAETRGIIIADTKFEFGHTPRGLVLADEVLTPDSSRFWPEDKYQAGRRAGVVRQAVRAGLPGVDQVEQAATGTGVASRGGSATSEKYIEAYTQMTGPPLAVVSRLHDGLIDP